jgi:hypothetical protein
MKAFFLTIVAVSFFLACKSKTEDSGGSKVAKCIMTVNEREIDLTFVHNDTSVIFMVRGFDPEFRKVSSESDTKIYQFSKGFQVDMTDEEDVMVYQIEKKTVIDTVAIFDVDTQKELTNIVESEVYDTLGSCRLGSFKN